MKNSNGWHVASVQCPVPHVFSDGSVSKYIGWSSCIEWCQTQFGVGGGQNWHYLSEGVFEFQDKNDHLLFLLRWGP